MHAFELATLASTFVQQASAILTFGNCLPREAVQTFWLNNRFRHDNWSGRLANHRQAIQSGGVSSRSSRWHEIIPVMQEILLSEPLTRCLAYFATVLEEQPQGGLAAHQQPHDSELTTLVQSTLTAHVEARHRCLHLIVFGPGLSVEHAVKLNRMRRLLEAYTDQLLAIMLPVANMANYAFEPESMRRAQTDLSQGQLASTFIRLYAAGLSQGLWKNLEAVIDWRVPNPSFNLKLSRSVLGLMPSQLFDEFGIPKTKQFLRFALESLESTGKSNDFHSPIMHPLSVLYSQPRLKVVAESKLKPRW